MIARMGLTEDGWIAKMKENTRTRATCKSVGHLFSLLSARTTAGASFHWRSLFLRFFRSRCLFLSRKVAYMYMRRNIYTVRCRQNRYDTRRKK